MNKKIIYAIISAIIFFFVLLCLGKKNYLLPNTYYQVYLDGNLVGTIKSKDKLEKYINNRGILIKNQVVDYQKKVEVIDSIEKIYNNNYFSDDINNQINIFNNYKSKLEILENNVDENGKIKSIDEIGNLVIDDLKLNIDEVILKNYDDVKNYLNSKINGSLNYIVKTLDISLLNEVDRYHYNEYLNNKYYDIDYSYIIYMRKYIEENEVYTYAENVYKPIGIKIEKVNTYNKEIMSEEEIYEKIVDLKPCTIEGYQFRIKRENTKKINYEAIFGSLSNTSLDDIREYNSDDLIIYTTDKEIFDKAIEKFIEVFVDKDDYEKYKNKTQDEIVGTGKRIENIDLDHYITVKKTYISVKDKIFTNSDDLSSYLLFGDNIKMTTATANASDTILTFAYRNQISVEEFFLFNREFTSVNNILYDGQVINIVRLNPQINLVVDEYTVEDNEVKYDVIEKYNSELVKGSRVVIQQGQNGINRVSQNVKKVNGSIISVEPISKETILGSTNEIVEIGTKIIPNVGSLDSWGWPGEPGYGITSWFGYRPGLFGDRHSGIDIGVPYGSNVYATNNGVVIKKEYEACSGYFVLIDHNNGFYSFYGHLSGFADNISVGSVVARGQVIGYVGQTGYCATGPHLHYQMNMCMPYWSWSCIIDPWPYLNK